MSNNLVKAFIDFNQANYLANAKKRILVALSGGLDSVVLCHLLHKAGYKFGIAHCNFKLRGAESEGDAAFTTQLAQQLNVPFFIKEFDTAAYATEYKVSIQVAARELRYQWFEEVRAEHKFDCIATAHHLNDNVETVLFNLAKGTGIKGLRGILPKQGKIIRPLLFASRDEILQYAQNEQLTWREDSSNASDKYSRNFIRHNIVPLFKEVNPAFESTFANNLNIFGELETQFEQHYRKVSKNLFFERKGDTYIAIEALKNLTDKRTILFTFLQPNGFTPAQVDDILEGLANQAGRQFFTANARLIQDRRFLILTKGDTINATEHFIYTDTTTIATPDFTLNISTAKQGDSIDKKVTVATIDAADLSFPLVLRRWKSGDYFYPFGMNNKKKKVKKLLIDLKVPLHEKEKVWVLESDKKIVWVTGIRLDERFKVTEKTENILKFTLEPNK